MNNTDIAQQSLGEFLLRLDKENIYGFNRYRAVKRFLDIKAREKGIPVCGSFELTPLCNFDCKMCYVHLDKAQMHKKLLTVSEWKDIMRQAVDEGMMYAKLTGGECLTYPGFRELYLYLRSMGVETGILSNGSLMYKDTVEFLSENKPSVIQISVYGASEEGYMRVTGKRCFNTVAENIKRLKDAKIPLLLAVTPSEFMTDGEEIIDLLHSWDIPFTVNSGLLSPRSETGRELHDAQPDTYISMIKRLQKYLSNEKNPKPDDLSDTEEFADPQKDSTVGVLCGAGRSNFSIDWHGEMKPCANFPCKGESVLNLGFAQAWQKTHATAVCFPQPAECIGCEYKSICKHCVAEHAAGAPCGHASPKICAWVKKAVEENLLKLPKKANQQTRRT